MNVSDQQRRRGLIAVALIILASYAVLSLLELNAANSELASARADLEETIEKLRRIERLNERPSIAALEVDAPDEISNQIANARQAAGLPQSSLIKEQPMAPQRIERSDFEQRSTIIQIAPATLPQILVFCDQLRDPDHGTVVRDLTLREPANGGNGGGEETWDATLTLTQIIFSPKSR